MLFLNKIRLLFNSKQKDHKSTNIQNDIKCPVIEYQNKKLKIDKQKKFNEYLYEKPILKYLRKICKDAYFLNSFALDKITPITYIFNLYLKFRYFIFC